MTWTYSRQLLSGRRHTAANQEPILCTSPFCSCQQWLTHTQHLTIKYHWSKNIFTLINTCKEIDINMSTIWERRIHCFTIHFMFRNQEKKSSHTSTNSFFYTGDKKTVKQKKYSPSLSCKWKAIAKKSCPPLFLVLTAVEPYYSSTARRWAPTEALCQACQSVDAAHRRPAQDLRWRWWRRRNGRSCAPSRGPFLPLSVALLAVERIKENSRKQRVDLPHAILHGTEMLLQNFT